MSPSRPQPVLSERALAAGAMIDIRVLGTFEMHRPDGDASLAELTQPKRIALLLYLALAEPAGPKSRDALMALLWPEADDESARHSLRNALYGLRQTVGDAAVVARGEGYVALDHSAIRCDALELRRLLAERRWGEAVSVWCGDLVPGFHVSAAPEFDLWLENQRTSLRRSVTEAAWRQVDALEQAGDAGLVPAAQRAWALDPSNEAGGRRLIRFLHASVGPGAALRACDELAGYLRRECDADPSAETQVLVRRIRARVEPESRAPAPPLDVPADPAVRRADDAPAVPSTASPSEPRVPRWPWPRTAALAAAAIVIAAAVSMLGHRPAASSPPHPPATAAATTGQEGLLRLPARYRRDTSAYGSYLRGLSLRFSGQLASRDTFAALVERAPLYAPGLSGLAHSYALSTIYELMPPAEGWPKVEAAARRALALDSASASAYLALGSLEMFWHWDLATARRLIDKGVALEPSDPEGHALRGAWFRWHGEVDSAVAEAGVSVELDPLDPYWGRRLGRQLYLAKRYAEAESVYRRTIRAMPGQAASYNRLIDLYHSMGRNRDALVLARARAEETDDRDAAALLPSPGTEAEASRWFADRARENLRALQTSSPPEPWARASSFAYAYAELRDRDATLPWLDSMLVIRSPSLSAVPLDPLFDFLRDDPRYRAWEAKLPWRQSR